MTRQSSTRPIASPRPIKWIEFLYTEGTIMTDPNRPSHWQVIDTKTNAVIDTNLSHAAALWLCNGLEPEQPPSGYRYEMKPIRDAS